MSCRKGSQGDDRKRTLKKFGQSINKMKKENRENSEINMQFIRDLLELYTYIKDDPGITIVIEDKKKSQTKNEDIADLQRRNESLKREKDKLETDNEFWNREIARLENSQQDMTGKNKRLQEAITSYQGIESKLSTEKDQLQKTLTEMTNTNERLEKENTSLKEKITSCQQAEKWQSMEKDKLEKALKEMKNEKERFEKQNTSLKEEITSCQQAERWQSMEKDKLEKALKEMKNEKERLEKEKTNLKGEITSYQQTEKLLSTEKNTLERALKEMNNEKERLEKEKTNLKGEITSYQQTEKLLSTEKNTLERALKEMNNEKERLEAKLEETDIALGNAERMLTEQHNINEQMKKQFKQYVENQQIQYNESLQDQRRTIDKLQKSLSEEKKAKDNALNRLSAAAASRLRDQNPGITDLSDPNRPLKLAEKVSELYDNEWTNGMENLENELGIEESQGIKILLQIVKAIFNVCSVMGNQHLESFSQMLVLPSELAKLNQSEKVAIPELPAEMIKPMKDFRKTHSDKAVELLQKYFKKQAKDLIKIDDNVIETCREYVDKCIELCWMMRIQDPPIHMESSYATNSEFDASKMRSYTKAGKFVHFVVWPTFFLHENGPLLAKGVVQGTKTIVDDITDEANKPDPAAHNSNKEVDKQDPAAHNCNTETDKQDHVAHTCGNEADQQDHTAQNSGNETDKQDPAQHNANHGRRDTSSSSSDEESFTEASTHP